MIVRRCSQGHRVRLHRNTTPSATRVKTYPDGTVAKKSNSFKVAEEYYVSECAKKHGDGHGRLIVGGQHIINGVATTQADYPTDSNTKAEIKDFYDKRGVVYGGSETKSELLSKITFTSGPYRAKHLKV